MSNSNNSTAIEIEKKSSNTQTNNHPSQHLGTPRNGIDFPNEPSTSTNSKFNFLLLSYIFTFILKCYAIIIPIII